MRERPLFDKTISQITILDMHLRPGVYLSGYWLVVSVLRFLRYKVEDQDQYDHDKA